MFPNSKWGSVSLRKYTLVMKREVKPSDPILIRPLRSIEAESK